MGITVSEILSFLSYALYYLFYPLVTILKWILIALGWILAPLLHLTHYLLHACLWPFRILAKFETLYIIFGVATVVGAVTGLILHLSSSLVLTTLNLDAVDKEHGQTIASYRAEKRKKQRQGVNQALPRLGPHRTRDRSLQGQYTDWLEMDGGQGGKGLQSTTILEENDDSEQDL
ncbi:hypothetical protein MMC16_000622 [Acarospora aff. strigata]|nr:hypothetical protein [Acarospora aff. strigata]